MKIKLAVNLKKSVLALGSQTKNTVCFAKNNYAYISRIHPDLKFERDFADFEKDVKSLLKKNPRIIATDLHPEYSSTKYASVLKLRNPAYTVLHHHAHIASCMAENGLKNKKVIGVAFDGTGLGADNTLWGGEFLVCDYKSFTRFGHLKNIPLIGAEKAILEPIRLLAAWFNFSSKIKTSAIFKNIYRSGFNSPLTSSMGRLFDAAASLILGKKNAKFEAELAIGLEEKASVFKGKSESFPFKITKIKEEYIIDPLPTLKAIIKDLKLKLKKSQIAFKFHQTIAVIITKVCLNLRKDTGINIVVLSGGVFQNKLLLKLVLDLLYKNNFNALTHKSLSCNDSSISLGQAVIAGL